MKPNNDILEKLCVKKLDREAKIIREIFSRWCLLSQITSSQWWQKAIAARYSQTAAVK